MSPIIVIGTEIIYAIFITAICLAIYFKTRDIYKLTRHSGIYHFRNIFLFFAFAYILRLVMVFILLSFAPFGIRGLHQFHLINLLLIGYFSTMAILSVTMTVLMKKNGSEKHVNLLHISAIFLSVFVFVMRSQELLLIIQTALFAFSVLLLFAARVKGNSLQNRLTYLLLFAFWIINLFTSIRNLAFFEIIILFYLMSVGIFLWIYFRVNKRPIHAKKKQTRNHK